MKITSPQSQRKEADLW